MTSESQSNGHAVPRQSEARGWKDVRKLLAPNAWHSQGLKWKPPSGVVFLPLARSLRNPPYPAVVVS